MKSVSILGDSISTFEGCNPHGYAVFYDKEMQKINGLETMYDTWWAKVIQALHARLCINNSYSGSRVTGIKFPAAVSDERMNNLGTPDNKPNAILIYIGFNDFGNGVRVRRCGIDLLGEKDLLVFEDAYDSMLRTMNRKYPNSKIVCGTLMRTRIQGRENWAFPEAFGGIELEEYNEVIRSTVKKNHCYLADIGMQDIRYETYDGSHPNVDGHQTIANAWIKCMSDLKLIESSM